jgi:hypothetical protein
MRVIISGNERGRRGKQDNVGHTIRTPPFSERKLHVAAAIRRDAEMLLFD